MSEEIAGFPAFPAGRRRSRNARSWWGDAWIKAMEDTSLDSIALRKGRRYATAGHVGPITVSRGRISAVVYGNHEVPYSTVVFIEPLTDSEWSRFLDQVASKTGHIAALLDKDMPHDLVDAAEDAGVRLLPGIGDLEPECSCQDWGHPCMHAAALCYQASWLLDEDPFVLLLMRGRGEKDLLGELRGRSEMPEDSETPPGIDPAALEFLVSNAASRAREVLDAEMPPPTLDLWQDTVRIATDHPELLSRLSEASGRTDLPLAVRAWGYGGPVGLDVLTETWSPPKSFATKARAAWEDQSELRVWRNRLTLDGHGVQLRYGRDERWYPYREEATGWCPAGAPARFPSAALADLLFD